MILVAALFAAIFVALCVAGHYRVWGSLLNLEVRPFEVASLLVSLFIALFLQRYLAARVTDRRAEKDLLIDSLRDVLVSLRACRDAFFACYESGKLTKENRKTILALVRRLANGLESLQTALSLSLCARLARDWQHIWDRYLEYKSALTGGRFPSRPYAPDSVSGHDRAYRVLNSKLQELLFKINRYR